MSGFEMWPTKKMTPKQEKAYYRNKNKFALRKMKMMGYNPGYLSTEEIEKINIAKNIIGEVYRKYDDVSREKFGVNVPEHRCRNCGNAAVTHLTLKSSWSEKEYGAINHYYCHSHFVKIKNEIKKNPELYTHYKLDF